MIPRDSQTVRLDRAAKKLLKDIGRPEPRPFVPDPFQTQATTLVLREDVLVSAPTGSGKTWIAVRATEEFLSRGRSVWYATPLKALSNAKYEEFRAEFGADKVGILTGDRKENADAPIIVGTTEILRNQLYDAMQSGESPSVDLVILDEAHYLGDSDRGVVWEEVLIYLPSSVRLLLLSATISNADMIAAWLKDIREAPCGVVKADRRPVPLHVLFLTPDGELTPFFKEGNLFPKVAEHVKAKRRRKKSEQQPPPDLNFIVETMRRFDLLPAIVFLKSRADCDKALLHLSSSARASEEGGFRDALEAELENMPDARNQRQMDALVHCRAGSHHAGQLPAWRLLIEKMMVQGHLDVIFSTSTVAAGVNFPARTVVILQSDRFDGQSFVDMTATDLHQMTGRAGRRGMDNSGFSLIVPTKFLKTELIKDLFQSEPEPLRSQIQVNFSMTLNLLLSHDPEGVRELMRLSFAGFQQKPRRAEKVHQKLLHEFQRHLDMLRELDYVDENGTPNYDGTWAAKLRLDHPLLIAELIRDGVLDDLDPRELAALIAPFVLDKDRDPLVSKYLWKSTRGLAKKFKRNMARLKPLLGYLTDQGFDVPSVMFWPAAAVYLWAGEIEWPELTEHIAADEGDLAMLIYRTADHLRQLTSLIDEYPDIAQSARTAVTLLMRPPLTDEPVVTEI